MYVADVQSRGIVIDLKGGNWWLRRLGWKERSLLCTGYDSVWYRCIVVLVAGAGSNDPNRTCAVGG
jgi:hypothetical protein